VCIDCLVVVKVFLVDDIVLVMGWIVMVFVLC